MNPAPLGGAAAPGAAPALRPSCSCPSRPSPRPPTMRVIDPPLVELAAEFWVTSARPRSRTSFLLANGIFVLVHGPFGDRYSKCRSSRSPASPLALCCLECGGGWLGWLAPARFLAGVASSAIIPLAIASLGEMSAATSAGDARALPERPDARPDGRRRAGRRAGRLAGLAHSVWLLAAIFVSGGVALFGVMLARPDLARRAGGHQGSMMEQMLSGPEEALGDHRHPRGGARGRRLLGRLPLRRRRPASPLRHRLRRHRARRGGVRRRRLRLRHGGAAARAPARRTRVLRVGGPGLGMAFATLALAPSVEMGFVAIMFSGISFYMLTTRCRPTARRSRRSARRRDGAVRALPVRRPGDRRAHRRADRRSLGRTAGFWSAAILLPALALWFAAACDATCIVIQASGPRASRALMIMRRARRARSGRALR